VLLEPGDMVVWHNPIVLKGIHRFRQHLAREHLKSAYARIRQHTTAYDSIRQHTTSYVSIREHTGMHSFRQPLVRDTVLLFPNKRAKSWTKELPKSRLDKSKFETWLLNQFKSSRCLWKYEQSR
jgi:hypothetical protein